jgi:hypothetical protein
LKINGNTSTAFIEKIKIDKGGISIMNFKEKNFAN